MKILNANGNLMFTIDANFFSISEWCMLISLHILKCMCVATRCWVLCSLQDLLPGYTMSNDKNCAVTDYSEGVGDNNVGCGEGD